MNLALIIQLISGAVGSNNVLKQYDLPGRPAARHGGAGPRGAAAGGGVGGSALLVIVGIVEQVMAGAPAK